MSKKRSSEKRRIPAAVEAATPDVDRKRQDAPKTGNPIGEYFASRSVRETIESVAIAFILAFLFRTFEAEAFVIPTGSMAETLRGQHLDLPCEQCGYWHMAGGSEGNIAGDNYVIGSTCPMCRHVNWFEPNTPEKPYFTGDRILVSKFVYDLEEPQRWDVVVFKFPFNAKQNYIKRLVGLPNESLQIAGGDLWTRPLGSEATPTIARKSPTKLTAMMQTVHDTDYEPQALTDAGWPARWQPQTEGGWQVESTTVTEGDDTLIRKVFRIADFQSGAPPAWLRYSHYTPLLEDWQAIAAGQPIQPPPPRLITDFYAYNAYVQSRSPYGLNYSSPEAYGMHWVGDLGVECDVQIESDTGAVLLDLVEAGRHYRCSIDVATGKATLSIVGNDGTPGNFSDDTGRNPTATVTADTSVRPGKHRLKLTNVDNQLTLWVDDTPAAFEGLTTYVAEKQPLPDWNDEDLGDLTPAGVGSDGAALSVTRLKVLRDLYYIAVKSPHEVNGGSLPLMDYRPQEVSHEVTSAVRNALDTPQATRDRTPSQFSEVFDSRRVVDFDLAKDQFFTLGDNSPQSQDARIWNNTKHYVHRDYLLGKALFIYWPHANGPLWTPNPWDELRWTFPLVPDFSRMKFVR